MPIARAQMRLKLYLAGKESKKTKEKMNPLISQIEDEDWNNDACEIVLAIIC